MKRKIPPEEVQRRRVSAVIREEEAGEILTLQKNLDYSEVLIQHAAKYLRLGWDLVAVNFHGEPALDLDFSQSQKHWAEKLTRLGLEGVQVNLGVRAGASSRLLVLEIHRQKSAPPFNDWGDWCSGCVAEVSPERQQHYYTLPPGWQPPASFFMEDFQIMVFGEGGVVLVPPSWDPRARNNLRWLRPPWESPPTRPSPGLCKFIRENAPVLSHASLRPEPNVASWRVIYPAISSHPAVLQALLAPAATAEIYYQELLAAAQAAGLKDPHLLFGLLWHAPLGNSRNHPRRAEYLRGLVDQALAGSPGGRDREAKPTAAAAAAAPSGGNSGARSSPALCPSEFSGPDAFQQDTPFFSRPSEEIEEIEEIYEPRKDRPNNGRETVPGMAEIYAAWKELCRFSQESLIVERRRYEAMIYELGKLGALTDIFKREQRQHRMLRTKLESQWLKELEDLRRSVADKTKKGWHRWW